MVMPEYPLYTQTHPEQADQLASRWGFVRYQEPPTGLGLILDDTGLQLKDFDNPKQQGVMVDFLSGASEYRRAHGGAKKEPIAKAIGVKGNQGRVVIDATPGLGRDAFVLAGLGCTVYMVERSAVVAALLEDGIRRLALKAPDLAARFRLLHGNSIKVLKQWPHEAAEAIYLDPMFPHRKKSALVKKEMKVFQTLLGADPDADGLLAPALALATQRVVVKRPNYADALAAQTPSMAITSKKHRFDVYLTQQ